jgi:hypothetical protein
MKVGDKVKFIKPEEEEQDLIFEILEDRDNRVLVVALGLFDNWEIKPTSVYLKSDLEIVSGAALESAETK